MCSVYSGATLPAVHVRVEVLNIYLQKSTCFVKFALNPVFCNNEIFKVLPWFAFTNVRRRERHHKVRNSCNKHWKMSDLENNTTYSKPNLCNSKNNIAQSFN
uniref:Uncharacterized protein LOC114340148 n=1 Tax=Diabrotica virgifera virgifera TaxID=50390 RepID=A0A6P7GBE6_DIAVI